MYPSIYYLERSSSILGRQQKVAQTTGKQKEKEEKKVYRKPY